MNVQKSLVFLKPDALRSADLICSILERLTAANFNILKSRYVNVADAQILDHYDHLIQKYGNEMHTKILKCYSGSKIFVLLLDRENAIQVLRDLIGATDPVKAAPGTIRGDLSSDSLQVAMGEGRFVNNLIHASDSPESASREEKIWL